MRLFEVLWNIFKAYRNYRKTMGEIRKTSSPRGVDDAMMAAFRRGEYERAKTLAADPFFRAIMATQLGELQEAEQLFRIRAQTQADPRMSALVHCALGEVLQYQKRYDEALGCFQVALERWPERGSSDRAIAELWLTRGGNPQEALRCARLGLEKEKAGPGVSAETKSNSVAQCQATLAWALAVCNHNAAEVERISEEASLAGTAPVTTIAQMNYQFGKAWAELGDAGRSAAHFETAAQVDPNGYWGRQAAALTVGNRS